MSHQVNKAQNFSMNKFSIDVVERLGVLEAQYKHIEKQIDAMSQDIKGLAKSEDLKALENELKSMKEGKIKSFFSFAGAIAVAILSNVIIFYMLVLAKNFFESS